LVFAVSNDARSFFRIRAAPCIRAACGLALTMFHHDLNHTGTLSCCADGCGEVEFTSGGELVSSSTAIGSDGTEKWDFTSTTEKFIKDKSKSVN